MLSKCRFRSRSLFSAAFHRNRKQSCLAFSLLSSAVAFSSCNTHTNPLLWSFLSQQSLLFAEGNWPAAAVACMYILLLFSKLFDAGICAHTHTLKDPSGSRLLLFGDCKIHTFISKVHYTPLRTGGISYLVCFTALGMTLIKKIELYRSFEQTGCSLRRVSLLLSSNCCCCVSSSLLNYFWLQQHRQRAFHIHKKNPFTDKRTHTQTLGSSEIVCWFPCHCHYWHGNSTQSWPGIGRSFFTKDQLALRVNSNFSV